MLKVQSEIKTRFGKVLWNSKGTQTSKLEKSHVDFNSETHFVESTQLKPTSLDQQLVPGSSEVVCK